MLFSTIGVAKYHIKDNDFPLRQIDRMKRLQDCDSYYDDNDSHNYDNEDANDVFLQWQNTC